LAGIQKIKNILIVSFSGIGDAVMFTPALHLLRTSFPEARIDLLCMFKGVEEIYQRNREIQTIYRRDFLHAPILSSLRFILSLRKRYDVSISVYPANRWEYNIINFLIGAKLRLGHEYNHYNFASLYFLNNKRVKENDSLHNVIENIELVKLLPVAPAEEVSPLNIQCTQEDRKSAQEWLQQKGISENSFLVGFHAGSAEFKNQLRRRWAPEKYSSIGLWLKERHNASILLFGGTDELALNQKINAGMNNCGHIVQTSFMTTAALMERCTFFLCNDTGLMHVAAGLQVPIVTIFAFTNPAYVYPWKSRYTMVRHELECSPCFYYSPRHANCRWKEDRFRCITHIEVDEVKAAIEKMLKEGMGLVRSS
jgi:heptosyltransferase-2